MIILKKKKLRYELVQLTTEIITLIKKNLKETQTTHKGYVENLKKFLVFESICSHIFSTIENL